MYEDEARSGTIITIAFFVFFTSGPSLTQLNLIFPFFSISNISSLYISFGGFLSNNNPSVVYINPVGKMNEGLKCLLFKIGQAFTNF